MMEVPLYIAQLAFQERTNIDIAGDFLAGAGDRSGISVAQLLSYLGERVISLLPDEVHGQAAG